MRKVIAFALMMALSLGMFAGMYTVADAKQISELKPVVLNYMDLDQDWKPASGSDLESPVAFEGTIPSGNFAADTKVMGGNPNDPISAAKEADDAYLKLENNLKQKDNYVNIIVSRPASNKWDRYELKKGEENVITISMDVASPDFDRGAAKSLGSCSVASEREKNDSSITNWGGGTADVNKGKLEGVTIENNVWYNVTMEIGSAEDERQYKVFVDGKEVKNTRLAHRPGVEGGTPVPMWLGLIRTGVQDQSNSYKLYYDNVYINVGEPYTQERYHVNRDASDLGFSDFKKDNVSKDSVVSDLLLADNYEGMDAGTTITWTSSDETAVNSQTGAVTLGAVAANVTLMATITNGTLSNEKTFTLTVPAELEISGKDDPAKEALYNLCVINRYKNADSYTAESFAAFKAAMDEALAVLGTDSPAKDVLDAAVAVLTDAINGLEIPGEGTLGDMMEAELDRIDFLQYIDNSSIDKITNDLKPLPEKTAEKGYAITWKSGNPDLMNDAGKIAARPEEDTAISMIASITGDGVTHSKAFEMTLYRDTSAWDDLDYINNELNQLEFADFCSQDPNMIVSPITLPAYLYPDDNVVFSWSVSNTDVASIQDTIARFTPSKTSAVKLDLIVTATRGEKSNTKSFPIQLICAFGDNLIVEQSASVSATSGSAYAVATRDFDTYWESRPDDANPSLVFAFKQAITIGGAVLCERGDNIAGFEMQSSDDKKEWKTVYTGKTLGDKLRSPFELPETTARYFRVVLTAKDGTQGVSLYSVEFFNEPITDEQSVAMDKELLSIPGVATSDLTLPTVGKYGSTITWISSNVSVISNTGKLTPGKITEYVTLTANLRKGEAFETLSGDVKVPVSGNISFGGSGGGGKGGSSGGSAGNYNTYMPTVSGQGQQPSGGQEFAFGDLSESHWAYAYVMDLLNKGIVSKDTQFRPEDSITREEFVKLLVTSLGLKTETHGIAFADVDENAWYHKYVVTAALNGIATGMGDDAFGIGMPITRQDMAVMTERALEQYDKLAGTADISKYSDAAEIAEYAHNAAGSLTAMGLMSGSGDGRFMPAGNTTRAEAAKIISLLYQVMNS